jgi:NADH-quinone oxidoreductase subunit C
MDEATINARVNDKFGARVLATYNFRGQYAITVAPETLRDVLLFLRDEADLGFDFLMDIGGVDYLTYPDADEREWRFEVAYQMYSLKHNHRFRVKVAVRDETVEVPTVWDLWNIANWEEREVYDMFGIRFTGHPNLRRILNHDEFVGHPLQKDYPINKRQKLSQPSENILCDKSELA